MGDKKEIKFSGSRRKKKKRRHIIDMNKFDFLTEKLKTEITNRKCLINQNE